MIMCSDDTERKWLIKKILKIQKKVVSLTTECLEKKRKGVLLSAEYEKKIGVYELERYKHFYECMKLRRKIELLQLSKNRNEKLTEEDIEKLVVQEVSVHEEQLQKIHIEVNNVNQQLESPSIKEETLNKIKDLYKKIVKELHPDLNPKQTEEMKRLWSDTQEAYERNDLDILRDIWEQLQIMGYTNVKEDIDVIEKLHARLDKLLLTELSLKNEIKQYDNEFPWNQEELLSSKWEISEKVESIQSEIERFKQTIIKLNDLYSKELQME